MKSQATFSSKFPVQKNKFINRILVNVYVLYQYTLYYNNLKKYSLYKDNCHIIKFEDLISNPNYVIAGLCNFLDVDYNDKLLNINVYGSSYQSKDKGFDKKTLDTWKRKLYSTEKKITEIILKQYMTNFNYL